MTREHRDRARYPSVEDAIGEDPARFLDRDTRGRDPLDALRLPIARIRGIDRLEVLARWQAVARDLDAHPAIIDALRTRGNTLREHGERPRRDPDPDALRKRAAELAPEDPRDAVFLDEDGEEYVRSSADTRLRRVREQAGLEETDA